MTGPKWFLFDGCVAYLQISDSSSWFLLLSYVRSTNEATSLVRMGGGGMGCEGEGTMEMGELD